MDAEALIEGRSVATEMRAVNNTVRHHEVVGRVAVSTAGHAKGAVTAASRAFGDWSFLTAAERAGMLRAAADEIEATNPGRAETLTREHGKPLSEVIHDVGGAPLILRYYTDLASRFDTRRR